MCGKNSSFASSIKGRKGWSRILHLYGPFSCFCHGQTISERKSGKEPLLSLFLSLPPLFLHYLHFFLSLSQSFLSIFLARRFRSHSVLAFLPFLALPLFKHLSSSSCYFFLIFFFGLGKMMKKKIRVSVDPGPSTSFMAGEEARARFKYQCLFLDYQELLKETEGKKGRLNRALQKKLKLLAEVKFLSKKYQSLSKIPPVLENRCRLNQQSCKEFTHTLNPLIATKPPPQKRNLKSKQVSVQSSPKLADLNHFKVPLKERNRRAKEAYVQSAPKLLDLNQVSLPNGEEVDLEVKWDPLKIENLKRSFVEGDEMVDNIKLSVCRDIGSSQSGWGTGKFHGKISTL